MNLEDSSMTLLRGHFAMTLICAGEAGAAELEPALVGDRGRLAGGERTRGAGGARTRRRSASTYLVTVHGADRLGIVARLAGTLADAGGNITDLTTRLTGDALRAGRRGRPAPGGRRRGAGGARWPRSRPSWGSTSTLRQVENDEL